MHITQQKNKIRDINLSGNQQKMHITSLRSTVMWEQY